ncbi:MAG: aspartate aminotransferase family protein [Candidatus Omnitrophica bacterium]|nr:aspartate aminotransferase family protein [Candidatus Omnitrophota bacterium]MDD5081246.1 aspartate aminotransferase family protein [Candidatus Omnitrophota bacterium]MDD5441317.1 aspartate aminotransferase family protein [Candidatus Omnitrophota bacterium]
MDIKSLYKKYSLNTYNRIGPVFVKGKGSYLWSDNGDKYLDLMSGWGVSILGHCHPRITKIVSQQVKQLIHVPNNLFQEKQILAAEELVKASFPAKVFFSNSGAESNEGAIKLSRLYGRGKRHEIITMASSFHGRTTGAMSITGQSKYNDVFKPLWPGVKVSNLNDFADFKKNVSSNTVSVILELVQGEGGVNVSNKDYVQELYAYCKKHDILFIVDEVQTGMGRTGKLFAFKHYGITPDIMTLSKGLGAGMPVGAIVVNKKIADIIHPGLHASTFGGSPIVCSAVLETLKIIKEEKIIDNVVSLGKYLSDTFKSWKNKYPVIEEVRGLGLMQGIKLNIDARFVFDQSLEDNVIINVVQGDVVRLLPSLNINKADLDKGLRVLEKIFKGVC